MTRRRILFPYVGDTVGGSHISSLLLVQGLAGAGHEPLVGLHRTDGLLAEYLDSRGQEWIALPDLPMPTLGSLRRQIPVFARAMGPLRRLLKRERIDIVHTNDLRMHQLWGLPARLAGAAHVWHQRTPTRMRRLDSYARSASAVITVSEFCRSELPPRLRSRAQVIVNPFAAPGIDSRASCRETLLRAMGVPHARAVIGFASNFTDRKRPMLFVELAAALLEAGGGDLVFPMFGAARPPLGTEVLAAIAQKGLDGRVLPMGPKFPIEPWLAGCDIFIAPARREAFGRTLVEAMFCGTPVVASRDGGHVEILRHEETGLLVAPDDLTGFLAATADLLDHPDKAHRLAEAARNEAEATYSLAAHLSAVEAVYAGCARP